MVNAYGLERHPGRTWSGTPEWLQPLLRALYGKTT